MVYLQHPSDPAAWWDPSLMVPAWAAVLGITDRTPAQLHAIVDAVGR